jgi:hypothetical protein
MRRRLRSDEEILAAIVELADDGFCPRRDLVLHFQSGERDLRRSISRAIRRGLLLERRGPDGRSYLALSSEGWEQFRAITTSSSS